MAWWSTPQPQADDHGTTSIPLIEADPDHQTEGEPDIAIEGLRYSQWERDEDGWPIIPGPGTMPPIWREE